MSILYGIPMQHPSLTQNHIINKRKTQTPIQLPNQMVVLCWEPGSLVLGPLLLLVVMVVVVVYPLVSLHLPSVLIARLVHPYQA